MTSTRVGCQRAARVSTAAGFTLIELMVTIAVLAIAVSVAAPAFTSLLNSNRLAAQANDIAVELKFARSEAMRRNSTITLCRSVDGATCADANGEWAQWLVVDADDVVLREGSAKPPLTVRARAHSVSFRGNGLARQATEFSACVPTSSPAENQRRISVNTAGRVLIRSTDGDGGCEWTDVEL